MYNLDELTELALRVTTTQLLHFCDPLASVTIKDPRTVEGVYIHFTRDMMRMKATCRFVGWLCDDMNHIDYHIEPSLSPIPIRGVEIACFLYCDI